MNPNLKVSFQAFFCKDIFRHESSGGSSGGSWYLDDFPNNFRRSRRVLEAFRQSLSGKPSEMDLAIGFKKLVFEWARDPTGLAIARGRLADHEGDRGKSLADNWRQHFLDYSRLAIILNSLPKLDINEIAEIRRWASEHDQGWATLFYAAGILLSVESAFPSRSVGSGLLLFSHSAKDKVKMLLDKYSQRDSWQSA